MTLQLDQLLPDHLRTYASQFTGGFDRLLTEGTLRRLVIPPTEPVAGQVLAEIVR